jgi:hypothetical protein
MYLRCPLRGGDAFPLRSGEASPSTRMPDYKKIFRAPAMPCECLQLLAVPVVNLILTHSGFSPPKKSLNFCFERPVFELRIET